MTKNNYEILGVSPSASEAEIKAAYKKLAKENHPDLHPNDKGAEDRIKEINAAYDALKKGDTGQQQFDHDRTEDIAEHLRNSFRDFFGGGANFGSGFGDFRNPNIRVSVRIPLGIAIAGGKVQVGYQRPAVDPRGYRTMEFVSKEVTIPADVAIAESITFPGEGGCDDLAAPFGALIITLALINETDRMVDQHGNMHIERQISMFEAALGTKLKIDTAAGKTVEVTVPPGTNTDTVFRVAQQGMRLQGSKRAHIMVHIDVMIPAVTDPDAANKLRACEEALFAETINRI